jgi:hypothetical protein
MNAPFNPKLAKIIAKVQTMIFPAGVILILGTIIVLMTRNTHQQQQIDTLTQLAQEAQLQTQQLSLQLEEMQKANELAREQAEMLRSQMAIYQNAIKSIQTVEKIDELLNKRVAVPSFKVYEDFSDEKTVGTFYDEGGLLVLENTGRECLILKLKPNRDNDFDKLSFHKTNHNYINAGGNVAIIAKHKKLRGNRLNGQDLDFDLFYRDADGKHYKQRFYGEANDGKWKLNHTEPVLAILSDD